MNSNQNYNQNNPNINSPSDLPTGSPKTETPKEKQTVFQPAHYQFKANTEQSAATNTEHTTKVASGNDDAAKERTARWLAILGFIAVIAALAWIVILVIGTFVPNLASILSLNLSQDKNEPTITLSSRSINHNDELRIGWQEVPSNTEIQLTYECEPGVSFELNTRSGGIQEIPCGTPYVLSNDSDTVPVTVRSTELRFADVPVSVSFIPQNNPEDTITRSTVVSLTNSRISLTGTETETENEEELHDEEEMEETTPIEDSTPTHTPPVATPPQPQYEYTYTIPQSDPTGYTDLGIRYLGVGRIESSTFTSLSRFNRGENGAIKFAVKNNGTRTSESWTYRAELPNGQVYQSPAQDPLRPNEEATIALGFRAPNEAGINIFEVTITTPRDTTNTNNLIRWTVETR